MSLLDKLLATSARLAVPFATELELTDRCNLDCLHCYVAHRHRPRLTRARACELVDRIAELGGFQLTLTGGEIGLVPWLEAVVRRARDRHLRIELLSSGTCWRAADWKMLARHGVHGVRLSLYAATPDIHDRITRVAGSFGKTWRSLLGLRDAGLDVAVACPILAANVAALPQLVELCERHEIPIAIDPQLTPDDAGDPAPTRHLATPAALRRMYRAAPVRRLLQTDTPRDLQGPPCAVGHHSAFIRCDGDVLPCPNWPTVAGNVFQTPYAEIFRTSPVFRACRALTLADCGRCARCALVDRCSLCPGLALSVNRSLAEPAPAICANSRARWS